MHQASNNSDSLKSTQTEIRPEPSIAIILPAYNESETIEEVVLDFHKHCPKAAIWVVDNNSSDNTAALARKTIDSLGCEGGVLFVKRQGKANAVRRAFTDINSDIYVLADADMTYPASDLENLLAPVLQGEADMVVGDRHLTGAYAEENKRNFHNFGNALVRRLINTLFTAELNDIMSGYRVFTRQFIKHYPILCEGFELETEVTLHALQYRYRVVEVPVSYKDRPHGSESKLNTVQDGFRVLKAIFMIFKDNKPQIFFSSVALITFVSGLLAGAVPIFEYLQTHLIHHIPLAILATGLMLVSLLLFSVGLILDTVVNQHRFDYEIKRLNSEKSDWGS